jgi:hypothetical protein
MRCLMLFMTSGPMASATVALHASNLAPGCACIASWGHTLTLIVSSQDIKAALRDDCSLHATAYGFHTFTSARFRYLPTLSAASYPPLQRLTSYSVATPLLTCEAPAQEMSPTLSDEHEQG